jgi:hypothetical protein
MESVAITNKNFRKDKKKNIHTLYVDAEQYNYLREDVVSATADIEGLKKIESVVESASYILALTDNLKLVIVTTAGASTVTVPPESDVAWPEGATIVVCQGGAGQVTVTPGSGVTINSLDSATKLTGQWASASLVKIDTDTWLLSGNIEA